MGQAPLSSEPPGLIRLEVGCGENVPCLVWINSFESEAKNRFSQAISMILNFGRKVNMLIYKSLCVLFPGAKGPGLQLG